MYVSNTVSSFKLKKATKGEKHKDNLLIYRDEFLKNNINIVDKDEDILILFGEGKNLDEYILPTRNRASMIVKKDEDHKIDELWLRKI